MIKENPHALNPIPNLYLTQLVLPGFLWVGCFLVREWGMTLSAALETPTMQDTQLYQQILGLSEPWFVQSVDLNVSDHRVDVRVAHRSEARWSCPRCGKAAPLHDHRESRTWRHLDTCQFQTHLHACVPRVNCPEHGVGTVSVPWAEPRGRFTLLMERFVIDLLQSCQNISAACTLIGLTWDQASAVMHRAVARGLVRRGDEPVEHLGVDEKRYRRGHVYATIVTDLDSPAVLEVIEGRTSEALACFYRTQSPEQLGAIQAVAMDMHAPYIKATGECVPDGANKIVFDRFHVIKQANEALERVRMMEHRQLPGDQRHLLNGARQMLLWGDEHRPAKYDQRFQTLCDHDLRTGRAWAMKEALWRLWIMPTVRKMKMFFDCWRAWVQRQAIGPMVRLARNLSQRIDGILRYAEHPLTTAACEGLNSRIAAIQHRAHGYRNFQRLRIAILFYCGQLKLHP